eukprot:6174571-Pleurochrysis_carterae.AAC.1
MRVCFGAGFQAHLLRPTARRHVQRPDQRVHRHQQTATEAHRRAHNVGIPYGDEGAIHAASAQAMRRTGERRCAFAAQSRAGTDAASRSAAAAAAI